MIHFRKIVRKRTQWFNNYAERLKESEYPITSAQGAKQPGNVHFAETRNTLEAKPVIQQHTCTSSISPGMPASSESQQVVLFFMLFLLNIECTTSGMQHCAMWV